MKRNNYRSIIILISFLIIENIYSKNINYKITSEIDTLYYLPDSATFISQYFIANEIYNVHTRFEPPVDWDNYKVIEINFLFSEMVIGDTLNEVRFYKDTLKNLLYSQSIGVVIDSNDVYPNWYKIIVPESSPEFKGIIEIPVYVIDIFSLCKTEDIFISGHTIGFFENSQSWNPTNDYPIKLIIEQVITEIDENKNLINDFTLTQNYPNPFNSSTTIDYSINKPGFVKLIIYDVLGQEVQTIVNEYKNVGNYKASFNASNLSSGIYFYRFINRYETKTRSMILLK